MEPPTKRYRSNEYQASSAHSFPSEEPSRVLHVTGLGQNVTEADLLEAFGGFGTINYASVKKFRYVLGLVEFEEIESAVMCVTASVGNAIFITGNESVVAFSSLTEIPRHGFESSKPNHVLVVSVYNVSYDINATTLKDICSPHGEVLRIAIVKKTPTILALVEFRSADVAKIVKQTINGADIYSGCCTLKVEYASVDHVRITIPDANHMDFTTPKKERYDEGPGAPVYPPKGTTYGKNIYPPPNEFSREHFGRAFPPLPPRGCAREAYEHRDGGVNTDFYQPANPPAYGREGPAFSRGAVSPPRARDDPVASNDGTPGRLSGYGYTADEMFGNRQDHYGDSYGNGYSMRTSGIAAPVNTYAYKKEVYGEDIDGSMLAGGQGCVIILYGVDQQTMNCDKLFNVFCQYGNVLRILFMKNKQTTAIFEMGNAQQARNLMGYLNGIELFGARLEFKLSFQPYIKTVREPIALGDGSPSFCDYTQSRNQRFLNHTAADRNRMCIPQSALYWFNAPPEMDGHKITEMFQQAGAPEPVNTHVFPSKTGRSTTGIAEFATIKDAVDAMALCNHTPVNSESGKHPFIVKVAFTASRAYGGRRNDGEKQSRDPNFVAHFSREDTHAKEKGLGDANDNYDY